MSNIVADIVESVEIKPNKTKSILKWIISISVTLISLAFVFGEIKANYLNKLNNIEITTKKNTESVVELKHEMNINVNKLNNRINKVYDDGYEIFVDFQEYNQRQLELFIDYGASNKEILKKVLQISITEKNKEVRTIMEKAKNYDKDTLNNTIKH